ncbi:MAG: hypothetical protein QME60_02530 [Verrucomicrobiota bacterium]|nr:hypothetical protein [Verrucomicrobiota bacterium]
MKTGHTIGFWMCVGVVSTVLAVGPRSLWASSMGWNDGFNSYTNGQQLNGTNGWSGPSSFVAQTNVYHGASGLAGKIPGNAYATNSFGVSVSKAWTDMYVKPIIGGNAPDMDSNAAVMFYFNSSSNPVVCDGATWVTVTGTQIDPSTWVRVTVFQNFQDHNWALFVNGAYSTGGLAFANSSLSTYGSFSIEHSGGTTNNTAYLDDMWAYGSRPDGVTSNSNAKMTNDTDDIESGMTGVVMDDAWELDYFYTINRIPGQDYDDDGVTDDKEFADGTNPTNAASCLRDIPWREGWENATAGTLTGGWHGWTYSGAAQVTTGDKIEVSKALAVSSGSEETASLTLSLTSTNPPGTNVWCLIYMKPASYGTNTTVMTDTCRFYVSTDGLLWAYSGTSTTNLMTGIPSNTWLAFAMHMDYLNTNWDLYVSTNGLYGSSLVRANSGPMYFYTNYPSSFTNLTVQTASTTYVDVVGVSFAYTNCSVSDLTNTLACDRLAGQRTQISRPPYNYTSSEDTMGAKLGDDLALGLAEYDRIRVFTTNEWNSYKLNVGEWTPFDTTLHISSTMGLTLDRRGGMHNVVFYPYGPWTNTDQVVYGTNTPLVLGWNLLSWPHQPALANAGSKWAFADIAGTNDRIFIYENYYYRDLYWKNSEWKESGATATYRMKPAQGFWYYRARSGTTNWPVSTYTP